MEIIDFLKSTFLFKDIDDETLNDILRRFPPTIASFKRSELVYSSDNGNGRVAFLISGKCEVRNISSTNKCVVINVIEKHGSFGILSALSVDDFPTHIFASKNSEVLFFEKDEIQDIVNNYSQISKNLVDFLLNRIHFLNTKIATFSGSRVENKLAIFFLYEMKKHGSERFDFNCLKTSEAINVGRASVYRALDSLEKKGVINFDKNTIQIIDREGLERISK